MKKKRKNKPGQGRPKKNPNEVLTGKMQFLLKPEAKERIMRLYGRNFSVKFREWVDSLI